MSPTNAAALSNVNGKGIEILTLESNAYSDLNEYQVTTDEQSSFNGWQRRDTLQAFNNEFEVTGDLGAQLNSDDSITWSGSASEWLESKVEYRNDVRGYGHQQAIGGYYGDWDRTYLEYRDADFDRTATQTSVFDPVSGQFNNLFSISGDTEVTLVGQNYVEEPWEKTPLELALESIFTEGSEGFPVPPPPDESGTLPQDYPYPSNPASHGFFSWFGGSAGDSGDVAISYGEYVGAGGEVLGSMLIEPYDWYLTARDIYNDPSDPLNYVGFIPLVPSAAGRGLRNLGEASSNLNTLVRNAAPVRVTGQALADMRKAFAAAKPRAWMDEAATNASKYTAEQLKQMKKGLPPLGDDGFSMEIHHMIPLAEGGSNAFSNFQFLTRTLHRLGANYKLNHPNLP